MAESQVIERNPTATVIRIAGNGQQLTVPSLIPILPIRNIVVFPGTVMPLNVGPAEEQEPPGRSDAGGKADRRHHAEERGGGGPGDRPICSRSERACMILKLFKLPDGNQSIIVHGLVRFRLMGIEQTEPFAMGRIEVLEDVVTPGPGLDALVASVRQQANRVIELSPNTPDEAAQVLNSITTAIVAGGFPGGQSAGGKRRHQRKAADAGRDWTWRSACGSSPSRLATQLDVLELQNKIQSQVKENIDKSQRRYYLQEQLKAIRKELGDQDSGGGGGSEVETLRTRLDAAQLARSGHEGGHPRAEPPGIDPQRQPGIWRHPHVPADSQRIALVGHDRRTRSIWPRPGRFWTAIITIWIR